MIMRRVDLSAHQCLLDNPQFLDHNSVLSMLSRYPSSPLTLRGVTVDCIHHQAVDTCWVDLDWIDDTIIGSQWPTYDQRRLFLRHGPDYEHQYFQILLDQILMAEAAPRRCDHSLQPYRSG